MDMRDKEYWIGKLVLEKHPEGGYFRETYRSEERIPHAALPERFTGDRAFSTAIYFLLAGEDISAFHRIKQDEMWHFYAGASLTIHCIAPDGTYEAYKLGLNVEECECPQVCISAGCYFAATVHDADSFTLCGCTVSPGFDFADFDMPTREYLIALFPQHEELITQLTHA